MLSDAEIGKCYKFSYQVTIKTEKYFKERNKFAATEKMIMDHFLAKMAEIVVYNHLTEKGKICSYPDFKIHESLTERIENLSHDSDLYIFSGEEKIRLHVKVCRFDSPVTDSWLIQKNDKTAISPEKNEYFAFCKFFSPEKIEICKIMPAHNVKWKEPAKNMPTKLACYLNDIEIVPNLERKHTQD